MTEQPKEPEKAQQNPAQPDQQPAAASTEKKEEPAAAEKKPEEAPKKEETKGKKGKKNKKKLEAERKAEEERQRLLKEEEDRKRAEEEERLRLEREAKEKEEAARKAEEERIRLEQEARERELAEKIVPYPEDEDSDKEDGKEKPEDKYYDYNGKKIKPVLIRSDITNDIKGKAFELGFLALSKFTAEKEMADYIKTEFDKMFEPEWQIVIGKDFSVAFSFEIENFVFYQIEDIYFLFYKL